MDKKTTKKVVKSAAKTTPKKVVAKKTKATPKKDVVKQVKATPKKVVVKDNDDMKGITKLFNIYFLEYMVFSLAFIIAGAVMLTEPAMATRVAEIITACVLMVVGVWSGFNYALKKRIRIFDFSIVYGGIALILGALIITNPFALTDFLSVAFGVFLIVSGLVKYNYALNFKFVKEDSWKLILTMAIVSILFGIVVIINPFVTLYFTQVIGLFMILHGVIEMTHTILLKQRSKGFLKLIK